MSDIVLKYPSWQVAYRLAVMEANRELLKQKIAAAEQAAKLRFKELENSADHGLFQWHLKYLLSEISTVLRSDIRRTIGKALSQKAGAMCKES
jgi:hypothetical protein